MDKKIGIDRLLWLAIALTTLAGLAVGAYGIQQEVAEMRALGNQAEADGANP